MVLDLFAGPGGWDLGLAAHGIGSVVGVEWDDHAVATRKAAGLPTLHADVAEVDASIFSRFVGLIASPPCQAFSNAGKRKGHLDGDRLFTFVDAYAERGWHDPGDGWADDRTPLILQPLRYIEVMPSLRWVAMEQVAPALPFFQRYVEILEDRGFSAWAGVLSAECYGVPQVRKRAFLIASRDGEVAPPEPTHSRYHNRDPQRLDEGVLPWVPMAEALGWNDDVLVGFPRRADSDDSVTIDDVEYRRRDLVPTSRPANALTEKARSWVALHTNRDQRPDGSRQVVDAERPAPTLTAKSGGQWQWERPATTVAGDPRLSGPGRNDPNVSGSQYGPNSVKLTVAEAAALQSFPPDHPWQGTKTAQFRQIGDAVPPLLAAAVLSVPLAVAAQEDAA